MTATLQIGFLLGCWIAFLCCLFLTLHKSYKTGVFGSIGLGLIALTTMIFFCEWAFEIGPVRGHSPQAMLLVIGLAMFLGQHSFRVIWKARTDRRKPAFRGMLDKGKTTARDGHRRDGDSKRKAAVEFDPDRHAVVRQIR